MIYRTATLLVASFLTSSTVDGLPLTPLESTELLTSNTKCGVSVTDSQLNSAIVGKLDAGGGLAFSTGWSPTVDYVVSTSTTGMKSVIWAASADGNEFFSVKPKVHDPVSDMLQGVNEPDGVPSVGSKPATPEEYAATWVAVVDEARTLGYTRFAGPQMESEITSNPDKGLQWQIRFMKQLDIELGKTGAKKSDYLTHVSYHIYEPNCLNDANGIAGYHKTQMEAWKDGLKEWWGEYDLKGFVVSELACAPWSRDGTLAGQMNMVQHVLPQMLAWSEIEYVSWFSAPSAGGDIHDKAHYLWTNGPDELTTLGEAYLNVCHSTSSI